MTHSEIADFWRNNGFSVRASNVLAKAGIVDEEVLLQQLTSLEKILSLKNCGRLTAQEIWEEIERIKMAKTPPEKDVSPSPAYNKLSHRAKHALQKLGIKNETQLSKMPLTREKLAQLRNVGVKTCDEIWSFILHLRSLQTQPEGEEQAENTSIKLVSLPLLGIQVAPTVWDAFTKIRINQIEWDIRIEKAIKNQQCATLADIAQIPPEQWLAIENFGRRSLTELREKFAALVTSQELEHLVQQADEQAQALPLLAQSVPTHVAYALRVIPIDDIEWEPRTRKGILGRHCKTLFDIISITDEEWLQIENFGRKSLQELKHKISDVLALLLHSNEKPSSAVTSFAELGQEMLTWLEERQQEVIKLYYGYSDAPKTLEEIGAIFNLTRERIRQIKEQSNRKLLHKPKQAHISKTVFEFVGKPLLTILHEKGGMGGVKELYQLIGAHLGWGKQEQWLNHWLSEAFGETWVLFGIQDYFIDDGICRAKTLTAEQEFIFYLARLLKQYGYRPLTLSQCQKFYVQRVKQSVETKELELLCQSHPHLKLYEYGEKYIGRKDWKWFMPENRDALLRAAGLVEWFLRLTNHPAPAKEIAYGIREKVGHFGVDPTEVIEACEDKPERFFRDAEQRYGLTIWKEATHYRQALTKIISEQPILIQEIVQGLAPEKPDSVIAALHLHEEFTEIYPFAWTIKKAENLIDLNNLTFEDLIPR